MNTQRKLIVAMSLCAAVTIPNIASAASVSGQGTWETTLQGRDLNGDGIFDAYYDTVLNITWLADANYLPDIYMEWATANAWVANLNPYDSGITDWRLPTVTDTGVSGCDWNYGGTDCGYSVNTETGEMAHMFYVTLGNKAYYNNSPPGGGLTNTGPFSNIRVNLFYWSDTEYALNNNSAWIFFFGQGIQGINNKNALNYAWAVHDGDVGVAIPSAVPIPAAAWLFGSGLLGLIGVARKRTI